VNGVNINEINDDIHKPSVRKNIWAAERADLGAKKPPDDVANK
jgi:hypothetical protein